MIWDRRSPASSSGVSVGGDVGEGVGMVIDVGVDEGSGVSLVGVRLCAGVRTGVGSVLRLGVGGGVGGGVRIEVAGAIVGKGGEFPRGSEALPSPLQAAATSKSAATLKAPN